MGCNSSASKNEFPAGGAAGAGASGQQAAGGGNNPVAVGGSGAGGNVVTGVGGNGGASAGGSGTGGAGGSGPTSNCAQGVGDFIFVVTEQNTLLRFYPGMNNTFQIVGTLNCQTTSSGATPFSMAVDRQGTAWVVYNDGELFHVSTSTGACTSTSYAPMQHGWVAFGMGFVADAANSNNETLFVVDGTSGATGNLGGSDNGLGSIDTSSLTLSPISNFNGNYMGMDAEVTGTGDGRLFTFFVNNNGISTTASVAEVDKTNANVLSDWPVNLPSPINAWAFAFWGGSFYLFNGPGMMASHVHQYTPANGMMASSLTEVVNAVHVNGTDYSIVGAGVSTCAPLKPPTVN